MIIDGSGIADTNNITIARNGSYIHRKDEDMEIDYGETSLELVYMDSSNGWVITNII